MIAILMPILLIGYLIMVSYSSVMVFLEETSYCLEKMYEKCMGFESVLWCFMVFLPITHVI